MKNKKQMLFPNCSEMVFRLTGSLEGIKDEVEKMIDCVIEEGKNDGYPVKDYPNLRKRIKNAKNLQDLEEVNFDFTCNYETYFREEDNDLVVATCNNHDWERGGINYSEEDSEKYWEITGVHYYTEIYVNGKHLIAKRDEEDDNGETIGTIFVFLEREDGKSIKLNYSHDKEFKMMGRNNNFFLMKENGFIKLIEIKDKKMRNKLKILANL